MRCRYCNKSISLLRRMNDAQFCTDAHRQAFGEEQQLALQRLTDTPHPMQKTQRMPVATPQAQVVVQTDAIMTLSGELYPDGPSPIPGPRIEIPAAPIIGGALVLFRDREHDFRPAFRSAERQFHLPAQPKTASLHKAVVAGQSSSLRVALPRSFAIPSRRTAGLAPVSRLESVPAPAPAATAPPRCARPNSALAVDVSFTRLHRPEQRRPRQLRPVSRPNQIELGASDASCGRASAAKRLPDQAFGIPAAKICYPIASGLAVTLAAALPEEFVDEKIWTCLESRPLESLANATQYTNVKAVRAPAGAPATLASPESVAFSPEPATATAAPAFAPASLASAAKLQPVEHPELRGGTTAQRRIAKLLATPPSRIIPTRRNRFADHEVSAETAILPLAAPGAASGWDAAGRNTDWTPSGVLPAVPTRAISKGTGALDSAAIVAVPVPPPAGRVTAPDGAKQRALPVTVKESTPTTRLRVLGDGLAVSGAVPFTLRPDPVTGERTIYRPGSLQTDLRLRLPRHAPKSIRSYGTADCVPIAPPENVVLKWPLPVADPLILAPGTVLPGPGTPSRQLSLRRLPARLYRVPGAQPMARPCSKKPLMNSFGAWGGVPSIRPSGLIADDGKRRKTPKLTKQFGRELYERVTNGGVQELWRKASLLPSDLKWITMVVPLIIGIWVLARPSTAEPVVPQPVAARPSIPGPVVEEPVKRVDLATVQPVPVPPVEEPEPVPPAKSRPAKPVALNEPTAWDAFTARIASRASVDLNEDFRNGLSAWDGRGEWARSWSYDRAGTVRPGHMAIFQPSVGLKDYVFEMKASIERHSIQWMVRAANMQNYHFFRLNVSPGAPLTRLELERWTVINGRVSKFARLPLPHGGANQTLYSIRAEVHGDSITTYLQDQVIDTFNDPRLQDGGIGLVGGPDDRPRIYGLRVTHQNDFFGKLCSFLAPQPIHTQGSD